MQVTGNSILGSALQGMRKADEAAGAAANRIVQGELQPRSIADLKVAEIQFKASAKVLEAVEGMQQHLLDVFV